MERKEKMDFRLDYRRGFLCVLVDKRADIVTAAGPVRVRKWFPVRDATKDEVSAMIGQILRLVDQGVGLYVDESGDSYTLQQGAATEAIEVEIVRPDKTTGLNGKCSIERAVGDSEPFLLTYRGDAATPVEDGLLANRSTDNEVQETQRESERAGESPAQHVPATPVAVQLSLKQKLAEVRRRIGQIEKRGHNQEGNYKYVRAADLAGAVGDVLAELGVILLPRLESISSEPLGERAGADHLTRVVISYTFADAFTSEEVTVKVAGEGADPADKSVCKAMTSALKYALLQSFLIATGDDPENDCGGSREERSSSNRDERRVSLAQAREVHALVKETDTELKRLLEYFEIGSLEEMTLRHYGKALTVLRKKLASTSTSQPEAA